MINENFNLQEEFNKRVQRLKEGNLFRIKQLANFMKFYNEDKKSMVEYFRDSFLYQNGDVPKIMFEALTDVISTTFFKESQNRNSYYIIFSDRILHCDYHWNKLLGNVLYHTVGTQNTIPASGKSLR